jgi:hypothetical protein
MSSNSHAAEPVTPLNSSQLRSRHEGRAGRYRSDRRREPKPTNGKRPEPQQPHEPLPSVLVHHLPRRVFSAAPESVPLNGHGHSHGDFEHSSSSTSTLPGGSRPLSSFAFSPGGIKGNENGLGWLDSMLDPTGGWTQNDLSLDGSGLGVNFASDQAQLLSLESPEHLLAAGSSTGPGALANLVHPIRREPQLEDVTSWANISHFISLFLQYLYPLLPLVHRPTFAENLATRRDLRDTDFRALLLSIGKCSCSRAELFDGHWTLTRQSLMSSRNYRPADW